MTDSTLSGIKAGLTMAGVIYFQYKIIKISPVYGLQNGGTIIQGCEHAIMDLYEPGHLYVNFFKDQMPGLKYLGTQKDKYGYDGWQWVWEPIPQKDVKTHFKEIH